MAKCTFCRSCLKSITIDNAIYLICSLCKSVYKPVAKNLELIIDRDITDKVAEKKGWKIE